MENARAELEKTHNLEEFKAKALETHKQAQEEMEAEVRTLYTYMYTNLILIARLYYQLGHKAETIGIRPGDKTSYTYDIYTNEYL